MIICTYYHLFSYSFHFFLFEVGRLKKQDYFEQSKLPSHPLINICFLSVYPLHFWHWLGLLLPTTGLDSLFPPRHPFPAPTIFSFAQWQLCHINKLLVILCVLMCSVWFDSLPPLGPQPSRFLCPWDFPSRNTGVGC